MHPSIGLLTATTPLMEDSQKAYSLFESGMLNRLEPGSIKCLQQIHGWIV